MIAKHEWVETEERMPADYVKICRCGAGFVPVAGEEECQSCAAAELAGFMRELAEHRAYARQLRARAAMIAIGFAIGVALYWLLR